MTATLLDFSRRAELELHGRVVAKVTAAAAPLGIDVLIVGAFARDLHLVHAHRVPAQRQTEDVDFALAVPDWKAFEQLHKQLLASGDFFRTKTVRCGADGGVDALLYRGNNLHPVSVVQCKAWSRYVGVKPVRELLGVMAASKVFAGVFVTTSRFTQEAIDFARGNKITLIDGDQLLRNILELEPAIQEHLLKVATDGDWKTPSCPSCAVKMVLRSGNGKHFWGCSNYPRCRKKLFYTGD